MKCIYIADDGTQFDCEEECREYEFKESIKGCNLAMLDSDLKPINNIERLGCDDCDYVYIRTQKDYDKLEKFCDYMGIECPEGIGSYFYDRNVTEWVSIDEKVKALEREIKDFKDIKKRLEK